MLLGFFLVGNAIRSYFWYVVFALLRICLLFDVRIEAL